MKTKHLEEIYPAVEHYVAMYDTPVFIDWFLEGVREIAILPEHFRIFLDFAIANNFASFFSDGHIEVFGMTIKQDEKI